MSVSKRKSGSAPWYYRFVVEGTLYTESGFATEREARRVENARREQVMKVLSTGTFSELVRNRLDYMEAYHTTTHYRDNLAMLYRFREWAELSPLEITPQLVREKLIQLSRELSNHNVNRHLRALRSVFQIAVNDGLLPLNPTRGVPYLPTEKPVKYIPTKGEVSEMLLQAGPLDRAYLTLIWLTAARVGEVNSLTWEDVNMEEGVVRLWTRKKRFGTRISRAVPLVAQARRAIEYAHQCSVKGSPWVFTNRAMVKKYPDDPRRWRYGYRRRLISGLTRHLEKPFRYHNLRHATASLLASLGVDITTIQKILGHERPTTTDKYLQSLPQGVIMAMGSLEKEVADVIR